MNFDPNSTTTKSVYKMRFTSTYILWIDLIFS